MIHPALKPENYCLRCFRHSTDVVRCTASAAIHHPGFGRRRSFAWFQNSQWPHPDARRRQVW